MHQEVLHIKTDGRGTYNITSEINTIVKKSACKLGLCNLFIKHTSASLIICENADPDVRNDLEKFISKLVPDGDPSFLHNAEGKDDMPAHIRNILTQTAISIPVSNNQLALGTWQGIFLWEHRLSSFHRTIVVTIMP